MHNIHFKVKVNTERLGAVKSNNWRFSAYEESDLITSEVYNSNMKYGHLDDESKLTGLMMSTRSSFYKLYLSPTHSMFIKIKQVNTGDNEYIILTPTVYLKKISIYDLVSVYKRICSTGEYANLLNEQYGDISFEPGKVPAKFYEQVYDAVVTKLEAYTWGMFNAEVLGTLGVEAQLLDIEDEPKELVTDTIEFLAYSSQHTRGEIEAELLNKISTLELSRSIEKRPESTGHKFVYKQSLSGIYFALLQRYLGHYGVKWEEIKNTEPVNMDYILRTQDSWFDFNSIEDRLLQTTKIFLWLTDTGCAITNLMYDNTLITEDLTPVDEILCNPPFEIAYALCGIEGGYQRIKERNTTEADVNFDFKEHVRDILEYTWLWLQKNNLVGVVLDTEDFRCSERYFTGTSEIISRTLPLLRQHLEVDSPIHRQLREYVYTRDY